MSEKRLAPMDILDYIYGEDLQAEFMVNLMNHKGNYSIAEVVDARFVHIKDSVQLISDTYHINTEVLDDDILTAVNNKLYISTFLCRNQEDYQVHFLVHRYPKSMKERFEEEIAKEVIQYMILRAVIALKLDSAKKVDAYVGR